MNCNGNFSMSIMDSLKHCSGCSDKPECQKFQGIKFLFDTIVCKYQGNVIDEEYFIEAITEA